MATRYKAADNVHATTLVAQGVYFAAPVVQRGQLMPMTAQAALERTGVQLDRPHEWLWDSALDNEVGDLLIIAGRWFIAKAPQEILDAEPITQHRRVVLAEIDPEPAQSANPEI